LFRDRYSKELINIIPSYFLHHSCSIGKTVFNFSCPQSSVCGGYAWCCPSNTVHLSKTDVSKFCYISENDTTITTTTTTTIPDSTITQTISLSTSATTPSPTPTLRKSLSHPGLVIVDSFSGNEGIAAPYNTRSFSLTILIVAIVLSVLFCGCMICCFVVTRRYVRKHIRLQQKEKNQIKHDQSGPVSFVTVPIPAEPMTSTNVVPVGGGDGNGDVVKNYPNDESYGSNLQAGYHGENNERRGSAIVTVPEPAAGR
jgi:hypothetical protein